MTNRDGFLSRVRKAAAQGNSAGQPSSAPERNGLGFQGAGGDLVQTFCEELVAVGGKPYVVADRDDAVQKILQLITETAAKTILLGRGPLLDTLGLAPTLEAAGRQVIAADRVRAEMQHTFFQADVGISAVDYLIAETGTIVVSSKPDDPRSVSLLPPVHIAVASCEQILPDLFDWFDTVEKDGLDKLASGCALITGPSKTGDIELKLVTGVHGPGEVHVVLLDTSK